MRTMIRRNRKAGVAFRFPLIILLLAGLSVPAFRSDLFAAAIPPDRSIIWSPGIPGGIPARTAVYTTLNASSYGNGATDATSAIQAAINACPVGQVVQLSAGTFKVAGTISVNRGVVLRGAGMGTTALNLGGTGKFTMNGSSGTSFNQTITSGYTKDSTSLALASTSGLAVGDYVAVTETKDPTGAAQGWPVNDSGCSWCGNNNGDYLMTQVVRVAAISGNVITLAKPLYVSYAAGLNPRVMNVIGNSSSLVNAGFEDFTINAGGVSSVIAVNRAVYCWFKNIEINNFGQYGIIFKYSYGCVVHGCSIHHGASETPSAYGSGRAYGIQVMMWNSDHLVENNILYHLRHMLSYEGGGSGCVFAYNYMYESLQDANGFPNNTWLMGQIQTHGAHPYMNLWEGNQLDHVMQDFTWGSDSHNTTYRSQIQGKGQPSITHNRVALEISKHNWYANIVGSVLGFSGMSGGYEVSGSSTGIYLLGATSDGGSAGSDPGVKNTIYRHGNFDFVNNTTVWDAGNPDRTLPASLYLTSKPAFFGNKPFPLIGPDLIPMVTDTPAKDRFSGAAPPPPSSPPPVGGSETQKTPNPPLHLMIN